ncbi:hypothetical protein AVEN_151539-1 [Araneus ventricosus]|uniref:Uncharacterized protein n=1 Tax=Araneus ventricosus TaxID=182803 RepID=A0A4Y2UIF8_ARAVE|nr:hypothetical protein AVEN_151539-1 [Araneus ventricosus]
MHVVRTRFPVICFCFQHRLKDVQGQLKTIFVSPSSQPTYTNVYRILHRRQIFWAFSYTGDIGRNLKGCEKLPLVALNGIECDLTGIEPTNQPTNLRCDQKYLLDICTSISSGVGSSGLAKRQPNTLNLARWLTTTNRILRLYISTSDPSNELITLVVFTLRVYAPSWFRIKVHHSIKDGARHL